MLRATRSHRFVDIELILRRPGGEIVAFRHHLGSKLPIRKAVVVDGSPFREVVMGMVWPFEIAMYLSH
jgi:hypothetical protein